MAADLEKFGSGAVHMDKDENPDIDSKKTTAGFGSLAYNSSRPESDNWADMATAEAKLAAEN